MSEVWIRQVRAILASAGFTVEATTPTLGSGSQGACAWPTVLHWPDLRDLPDDVHKIGHPLVLVTSSEPGSLRLAPRLQPQVILLLGEEETLPAKLRSLAQTPVFLEIQGLIYRASHLSPVTRAALRVVFRPESDPAWSEGGRVAVKRISELARAVGVSPDYLGRVARRDGVDLRFMMDAGLVIRALRLHDLPRTPWERVAWHLGYSSGSGLHRLFKRVLGLGPEETTEEDALCMRKALIEILRAGQGT